MGLPECTRGERLSGKRTKGSDAAVWWQPEILQASLMSMQVQEQGWLAQHVLVYDDSTSELMGCVPLYLKTHSYGEYVFDHSWASTHSRCGIAYYPKLQSCVPFTPVTGNRLLIKPGINAAAVTKALAKALLEITGRLI